MVRPLLQIIALVTVIVFLLPPVVPMVIRALLEKVTALLVPMTFRLLFVSPAPVPTVMAPLPTYVPPLVTVRLLKPLFVKPPMTSVPVFVHVEPGPVTVTAV